MTTHHTNALIAFGIFAMLLLPFGKAERGDFRHEHTTLEQKLKVLAAEPLSFRDLFYAFSADSCAQLEYMAWRDRVWPEGRRVSLKVTP